MDWTIVHQDAYSSLIHLGHALEYLDYLPNVDQEVGGSEGFLRDLNVLNSVLGYGQKNVVSKNGASLL